MKETLPDLKRRAGTVVTTLKKDYPDATVALHYENVLELLIATILSAQCTDVRVNMVTPALFRKYKTARDYANADIKDIEKLIHSTGFFRAKARNITECCKMLDSLYKGKVPDTLEQLIQLPGVGRKTANVVLGGAFGIIEGVVVDTHVKRLSNRLGFTKESNPEKVESDLMNILPKKDWFVISNLLIRHGRKICDARNPKCEECSINKHCPSAFEVKKK